MGAVYDHMQFVIWLHVSFCPSHLVMHSGACGSDPPALWGRQGEASEDTGSAGKTWNRGGLGTEAWEKRREDLYSVILKVREHCHCVRVWKFMRNFVKIASDLLSTRRYNTLRRKLQTKNVWLPVTKFCTVVDFCAIVVVFLRLARTVK